MVILLVIVNTFQYFFYSKYIFVLESCIHAPVLVRWVKEQSSWKNDQNTRYIFRSYINCWHMKYLLFISYCRLFYYFFHKIYSLYSFVTKFRRFFLKWNKIVKERLIGQRNLRAISILNFTCFCFESTYF